ncbi:MAG: glycosyltransferase family 2 protein [Acidimicrobiales bacterium]
MASTPRSRVPWFTATRPAERSWTTGEELTPLLGAALIVKDEERVLGRCLGSIRGVVDEIVVVDTGSTDRSVSVAESFGARVIHREWDGDFSAARNHGLDHLRSHWVLYIDADEYLSEVSKDDLSRRLATRSSCVAYRVLLRARPGYTPYREYRIWRNRPDIRFWGVIHESHVEAIEAVVRAEGSSIEDIDILLEHDGYEGDQTHKHERNLPLLLAQVEADPERSYLWDHIGRIHAALGHNEQARSAWERGRQAVLRRERAASADVLIYSDLIADNAVRSTPDPDLVAEADLLFPDNIGILWAGALDAEARGDPGEVARRVDRLVEIGPSTIATSAMAMDERVLGEWAFHLRGGARFRLGDIRGAAADFAAAERCDPDNDEYRVKRALATARISEAEQTEQIDQAAGPTQVDA